MISIVIPVYNQAAKLGQTLLSIQAQSYRDFEVIIVNDGSSDNPEKYFSEFIAKLKPENNYVFLNQSNQGAPAARNRGRQEAKGEYLFFCDADAILSPRALEIMWSALEEHWSASYAYSSFKWGRKLFRLEEFNPDKLRQLPYIHTMSLIRTKDFPVAGWDQSIKKLQDWDLWLTMLEDGKLGLYIPEVLFTVSPGGTISTWLPAFAYKLLPFLPAVKKYKRALKIVKEKHGLA